MTIRALSCLAALLASNACFAETELAFSFRGEHDWKFEATGPYEGWADRRDLYVLYHPWEESRASSAALLTREVTIPSDWQGAPRLHFYMTDDYDGQYPRLAQDSWLGQCNLIGHRFKQVLVDDQVIWERDVADAEGVNERSRFAIDLPERIKPGDSFRLGFRLFDKVASAERLDNDFRHVGSTDGIQATDVWKFMSHVYIGDVILTPNSVDSVTADWLPSAKQVANRHREFGPPQICRDRSLLPAILHWEGDESAAESAWPVRSGAALPRGAVGNAQQLVVRDSEQQPLPAQLAALNRWDDGSLRWVLIDTICRGAVHNEITLAVADLPAATPLPNNPVLVEELASGVTVLSSGQLQITCPPPGEDVSLRLTNGDAVVDGLAALVEIDGRDYAPEIVSINVLSAGPIRGELELAGQLQSDGRSMGRFIMRVSVYADQPMMRMTWRIFNDLPQTQNVARLELVARHEVPATAVTTWGDDQKSGGPEVLLRQPTAKQFEVLENGQTIDHGDRAAGFLAFTSENHTLAIAVRHFWQQFPKALEFSNDRVRISLFEATDDQPAYLPTEGEAKRHELWIGLWDEAVDQQRLQAFGQHAARPPRWFDSSYVCATGGLGRGAVHDSDQFPQLDAFIKRTYPEVAPEQFYEFGIRNWGDQIYDPAQNFWRNGYYDRQQGLAAEYLMSGDPRWFDRLEAVVRHIMDIDVCHASQEHPKNVGAIYGYNSPNHTNGQPWNPTQRIKGMLSYWRLSGDVDARDTALGVADYCVDTERAIGASSSRDHAGILYCLVAAYDETHDRKYLDAAKRVAVDAIGRIDLRRGCYSEIHGNTSYRGNVPWMDVQLAEPLFDYYCHSGDVMAAQAVVAIADSILTENNSRDVPGDVAGYSHNPHFQKTSSYHILIAPAIMYAYDLTDDEFYLQQARAMYDQTIRENTVNSIGNCYWNTPTLLYYLKHFGQQERGSP